MKCLNCGKDIDDNIKVCPYCGSEITEDMDDATSIELPVLKDDEEVSLEKTRAISPIKDNELSLMDDINNVIEQTNNGKPEIGNVNVGDVNVTTNSVNAVLTTKESINKRKVILAVCLAATLLVVIFVVVLMANQKNTGESVEYKETNYLDEYSKALNNYYENGEIDDLVLILQNNKDDADKIKEINNKTRIACDSWLLSYIDEKAETREDFETITEKYEEFLHGLNTYAVATNSKDEEVKALLDSDYRELSNQLNDIYEDSVVFFDGLDLYNSKDYNKAYSVFETVDTTDTYYDKAVYYMNKIVDNILELLTNDISKLQSDLDGLSNEELLDRYIQIEDIIIKYNDAYVDINLDKNEEYKTMLENCRSKIDEYSNINE